MERRLKMQTGGELPPPVPASTSTAPPTPQKDVIREQDEEQEAGQDKTQSEQGAENKYAAAGSRPGNARPGQQAVPGALPPTPIESEGESSSSSSYSSVSETPVFIPRAPRVVPRIQPPPFGGKGARASPFVVRDSDSVMSLSTSSAVTDYVLVSGPDGDGERDA